MQGVIYQKYLGYIPGRHLTDSLKELDHSLAVAEYLDIKEGAKQTDLAEPHGSLQRMDVLVEPQSAEAAECAFLLAARMFGFLQNCLRSEEAYV